MASNDPNGWYRVAITQLLLANGLIDSETLMNHLKEVAKDFPGPNTTLLLQRDLKDSFSSYNANLRKYSLEIRTVVIKTEEGNRYVHGIANTEDDFLAKDFGSKFDSTELAFFKHLLEFIVQAGYVNMDEIHTKRPPECALWSKSFTQSVVGKLRLDGWLQMNNRSYWELGPRTFLELSSYVTTLIENADDGGDEKAVSSSSDDAAKLSAQTATSHRYTISRLPQVIIY